MTIRSALVAALAKLPSRTDDAEVTRDLGIPMRDGAVLRADLWRPSHDSGSRALVIVRTPYDRAGLDLVGRLFAERGHPVLLQNSRGTFGSGGSFVPFTDEGDDGVDLLEWLDSQPWARRPLALLGASYLGYTSYTLITTAPERFVAISLAVTSSDFHTGVMYPHGAIGSETALTWIGGMLTQELPPVPRLLAERRIRRRMRAALLTTPARADTALLGSAYPPYQGWVEHDRMDDPWWSHLDRSALLPELPPASLVAGWYDPFLVGQLADHAKLIASGRAVSLVVGPWTHGSPGIVGALARTSLALLQDPASVSGVTVNDTGTRAWVQLQHWPPVTHNWKLFLAADGMLADQAGPDVETTWTVDPGNPPPPAGGRGLNPAFAGQRRQTARERRGDVFIATSDRLGRPVTIAGSPTVELRVPVTRGAQEWFVRLCDVDRFGVSRNVCDGYVLVPGTPVIDAEAQEQTLTVELAPAAHTMQRGHRIRVQLSGSGYPFHPAPPNQARERRLISRINAPSSIRLPLLHPHEQPTRK